MCTLLGLGDSLCNLGKSLVLPLNSFFCRLDTSACGTLLPLNSLCCRSDNSGCRNDICVSPARIHTHVEDDIDVRPYRRTPLRGDAEDQLANSTCKRLLYGEPGSNSPSPMYEGQLIFEQLGDLPDFPPSPRSDASSTIHGNDLPSFLFSPRMQQAPVLLRTPPSKLNLAGVSAAGFFPAEDSYLDEDFLYTFSDGGGAALEAGMRLEARGEVDLVWKPETGAEDGALYTGQWRGPRWHGEGVLVKPNGQRYEGSFVNGEAHGQGTVNLPSGDEYRGAWQHDRVHGYGVYIHRDGSVYQGEWCNDEKSGHGVEHWRDGATYSGQFLRGLKHGDGKYTSSQGAVYEGQFKFDLMDGEGQYGYADGRIYLGHWLRGHMDGVGKMTWPNGATYEGGYECDAKHGEGTYVSPDGRVYKGQWLNGKRHGLGESIDFNGVASKCEWRDGERASMQTAAYLGGA